jgi:tRNA 2-thiouridine synthesizing protein A
LRFREGEGGGEFRVDEAVLVDVRGLKCPLPVLKTARRMRAHAPGTRFVVLTTDPMAAIDVPHFCAEKRHRLLARKEEGGVLRFEIEKGAAGDRAKA